MTPPRRKPGTPEREITWHRAWAFGMAFLVLICLAIRYAEPVRDTDLYWQMAYGRQMVETGSIKPDHALYTWTPSETTAVYCAWLPEVLLHLLHQLGGLAPLFALRYLCLLFFAAVVLYWARRHRVLNHPLTWAVVLLGILMSRTAAFLKPEIFSYVLMIGAVSSWFALRAAGEPGWRRCYMFPALMLVWVNTHGGFIFGALFYATVAVGETLNRWFSPAIALPSRTFRHLWISMILSALTVFATPYGAAYPVHLLGVLTPTDLGGQEMVRAYQSIFHPTATALRFPQYLSLAALMLVPLLLQRWRRRRFDWALVLSHAVFLILYVRFLRTTYFWVPIFALTAIQLLAERRGFWWPRTKRAAGMVGGVIGLILLLSAGQAVYASICRPLARRWCGFGVSYTCPVHEAEYIGTYFPGERLGNDYDNGGYLLWALGPETQIMVDARRFPFKSWLPRHQAFLGGQNLDAYFREFPCRIYCVSFQHQALVTALIQHRDWNVAFFGPSSVVFVRRDLPIPDEAPRVSEEVGEIRNLRWALHVLRVAVALRDLETADHILERMHQFFRCPVHRRQVEAAEDLVAGTRAYYNDDFTTAVARLESCRRSTILSHDVVLAWSYNRLTLAAWERGDVSAALGAAESALRIQPGSLASLYNAGAIEWMQIRERGGGQRSSVLERGPQWNGRLRAFH